MPHVFCNATEHKIAEVLCIELFQLIIPLLVAFYRFKNYAEVAVVWNEMFESVTPAEAR